MTATLAPRRRPLIDRSSDRLITLAAIAIAVGFLLAAVLSLLLPPGSRRGLWLPLHLALAGAATTAIAGVMPFFSATLAAAPPAGARLRAAAVGTVALGALGVASGVTSGWVGLAVAGGTAFVLGIALTGAATVGPLRGALGPSRGIVSGGYVAALVEVAVGASLATLFLAGWPPLAGDWARVKPAHAWLNLVGFVSVVVATTLLHLFPTVIGARIAVVRSARVTVYGLALGAGAVAGGYLLAADLLARAGAGAAIAGSLALAVYAGRVWRTRARWTTDPGWHRFAIGGLVSAIAWFVLGIGIASGRVVVFGADPSGWLADAVAGPLVIGWIGLAITASATHLVPAIGPGDPVAHARQRRLLGQGASIRLGLVDGGAAALALGLPLGVSAVVALGAILLGLGLGATAILIAASVAVGIRRR